MDGCKSEGRGGGGMYREGDEGGGGGFFGEGDEGCWIEIRRFEILAEGKWFECDLHGENYRGYMVLISKAESVTGDPAPISPRALLLPKMVQLRDLSN